MTKEELIKFVQENYGVACDTPFKDDNIKIFRHLNNKKWFAALLRVQENKIRGVGEKVIDILDVKTDPLIREPMLKKKGVYIAYHMNKVHWLTIDINEIKDEDLEFLLDLSFELTKK